MSFSTIASSSNFNIQPCSMFSLLLKTLQSTPALYPSLLLKKNEKKYFHCMLVNDNDASVWEVALSQGLAGHPAPSKGGTSRIDHGRRCARARGWNWGWGPWNALFTRCFSSGLKINAGLMLEREWFLLLSWTSIPPLPWRRWCAFHATADLPLENIIFCSKNVSYFIKNGISIMFKLLLKAIENYPGKIFETPFLN